jgi:Tol biopolymer transport system component
MADQVNASYQQPSEGFAVLGENKKGLIYHQVKISPNGSILAYSTNFNGKYEVRVRDLTSGQEESVLKGGYKVINQEVDEEIPLLAWKDNNTLGIINVDKAEYQLIMHDIGSGRSQKRSLGKITQVKDFQFHENGKTAIVSADSRGQNDLFLLSLGKNSMRRITNDSYDDLNPEFIPGTNQIVFSSNRTNDTIKRETVKLDEIDANFNLFIMNMDSVTGVLTRVTNTLSHDIQPIPQDSSVIYYISDQKGIYNLYKYEIKTKLYNQISNFSKSIKQFDLNLKKGSMAYIMTNEREDQIYYQGNFNLNQNNFTPLTRRQEVQQALFISERIRQRRQRELEQLSDQQEDTVQITLVQPADSVAVEAEEEEALTGAIDTDNYVFDTEVLEEVEKETESEEPQSILQNFRAMARESEINGPYNYEPRVGFDNIVFSWVIDPLIGFGIQAEVTVNDLLENHKFYGGVLATTDLRSGSYYGEYHFLKDRLDYYGGFKRRTLFRSINDPIADYDIKYIMNRIEVGASYPINIRSRITISPFYTGTRSFDLDPTKLSFPPGTPGQLEPADTQRDYVGGKLEYVYDNTVVNGLNFEGTRINAFFEHYESINDSELNFNTFKLDLRHYHKIHRELIFAGRLFYARSFGNDPKDFLLGGMSNWLFNDTDNENNEGDPLFDPVDEDNSDILFVEYVTNMRGFDYNKFSGNNALLFNAELRFPVIKFFNSGPIASNFFRNLQLIGFYDLGSAWTGNSPLADENSLNTETIEAGNFKAKINNFGSAWLASYGTGVRTVLLGYYLKFDVAWPIEDYEVGSPQFYLTLGYDF